MSEMPAPIQSSQPPRHTSICARTYAAFAAVGAFVAPGASAVASAIAAAAFTAAHAYGANARARAAMSVPSERMSAKGTHQTRSLNAMSPNVRTGSSPLDTASSHPIGPRIFPARPIATIGRRRTGRHAAYPYRRPYRPTTMPSVAQIDG